MSGIDFRELFYQAVDLMARTRRAQLAFYREKDRAKKWAHQQKAMELEKEQDEFITKHEQGQGSLFDE